MSEERINIHLYQSPFQHESRILRITETLSRSGYFDKIYILATFLEGLDETENISEKITVYRVKTFLSPSLESILRYFFLIEWGIRILLRFRKNKIVVVNSHSVPTLPIAWAFKKVTGCKIVYDTHEIETEQYVNEGIKKKFSKFLEKSFIQSSDLLVTVSDGCGKWYRESYGLKDIAVVKNYPASRDNAKREGILRKYCSLKEDDILFIYHGIIAFGRGIEFLLEIFSENPGNKHLVFMGYGPQVDLVKEYSSKFSNIHFHPAVNPAEVYRYVSSCDTGFCIIENLFLSYYYSLPNKLLECLNVGVPVIVSNFPDMRQCIEEYQCGWTTEVDGNSIKEVLSGITFYEIQQKRANALKWAEQKTWESQELILHQVYQKLLENIKN